MLERESDPAVADHLSDSILNTNSSYFAPYSIKAKYAYSEGNFDDVIVYKHLVFEKNPFEYNEYDEYARMLINGIYLYNEAGDLNSAEVCKKELLEIPELLKENKKRLSYLGKKIKDQPKTELEDDIFEYINSIE